MRSILPLLLVMAVTSASSASAQRRTIPIADARRLPLGEVVTVEGSVSVASGIIDAGFAVQEGSGGIYVDADSSTRVTAFQLVRVTGRLVTSHGLLRIAPTAIEALPRIGDVTQLVWQTATGSVGEATEGRLIFVEGKITGEIVDDRPYGWKMTIDDGSGPLLVFISVGARIDIGRFRAGQRLRVSGFSGQYDNHHEIHPRSEQDVEIIAGS